MGHKNLVELFKEHGGHLKVDNKLISELIKFNQHIIAKNANHVEFFGGMLVGVERLSFAKEDFNRFFDDVVDMDQLGIKQDIMNTSGVDKRLTISTDAFSNTCMWLVYLAMTDRNLKGDKRRILATESLVAMHLRFMVQLQWKYFRHQANREVAQAALNKLNNRYDLKINGSWYETIKARCADALDPSWRHFNQFKNLKDADEVRKMLNRLKGGIEQVYQKQSNLFYDHHKEGIKVEQMSAMFDGEEGKELKALTNEFKDQHRYLNTLFNDRNGLIKDVLLDVIGGLVSVNNELLVESLEFLVNNATHDEKVSDWVECVLVQSHTHLKQTGVNTANIIEVMTSLRNVYTSSRASDSDLDYNKTTYDRWLSKFIHTKKHKHIPNVRTATMLYLILRLMTRESL